MPDGFGIVRLCFVRLQHGLLSIQKGYAASSDSSGYPPATWPAGWLVCWLFFVGPLVRLSSVRSWLGHFSKRAGILAISRKKIWPKERLTVTVSNFYLTYLASKDRHSRCFPVFCQPCLGNCQPTERASPAQCSSQRIAGGGQPVQQRLIRMFGASGLSMVFDRRLDRWRRGTAP